MLAEGFPVYSDAYIAALRLLVRRRDADRAEVVDPLEENYARRRENLWDILQSHSRDCCYLQRLKEYRCAESRLAAEFAEAVDGVWDEYDVSRMMAHRGLVARWGLPGRLARIGFTTQGRTEK